MRPGRRAAAAVTAALCMVAWPTAPARAELGPMPMSLKGVPTPVVPGLYDGPAPIIVDRAKAVALGKALFWDIAVGSDGVACATCHHHAGADARTRHQVAPAGPGGAPGGTFDPAADGVSRGPNLMLRRADFPFVQTHDPLRESETSGYARESDDVVGSSGSFGGDWQGGARASGVDLCARSIDPIQQVHGLGARRVTTRHAPSVINAVFMRRLMWDGRASPIFNGRSAEGAHDTSAHVWVQRADGRVSAEPFALDGAALASQAMLPPLSDVEMACRGRTLADLGRKLLPRQPLALQAVHPSDSVLGALSDGSGRGLATTYLALVQQAFAPRFWAAPRRAQFGRPAATSAGSRQPYTHAEANFSLYFGLALMAYQATLVSDDSPFDRSARDAAGRPVDLTAAQQRGLEHFRSAHCAFCHLGPVFTSAAVDTNAALVARHPAAFGDARFRNTTSGNVVMRLAGLKGFGLVDTGFAATGVARDTSDPGLAGLDADGLARSDAAQLLQRLAGRPEAVRDPRVAAVRACDLPNPLALDRDGTHPTLFTRTQGVQPQAQPLDGCLNPAAAFEPTVAAARAELARVDPKRLQLLTDAAFKIPSLRNVELTGPYMHNGSMSTLEQVIEFYARGGNHAGASKQFGTVFGQPALQLDAGARAELVDFLTSLTDDRVRFERAPFDHPELPLRHGHANDALPGPTPGPWGPGLARDRLTLLPAVGAAGRATPLPRWIDLVRR